MQINGGTLDVSNCSSCGDRHDDLEVSYVYPPVQMAGMEFTMSAVCPKTGETIYLYTIDMTNNAQRQ